MMTFEKYSIGKSIGKMHVKTFLKLRKDLCNSRPKVTVEQKILHTSRRLKKKTLLL